MNWVPSVMIGMTSSLFVYVMFPEYRGTFRAFIGMVLLILVAWASAAIVSNKP